jgi:pimeloyl-ACP methyl ester carboxylesterase
MAFLDNQGVQIYYEVHGSGPTILLSHGYSETSQMWQGQTTAFEGYQVITWDMRGHGKSGSPDDASLYSAELTLSDMQAILDQCNVNKAVVGGLSLGGYMSLAFNYTHKDRVSALLLFDTGPGFKNDKARAGWNDIAAKTATSLESEGFASLGSGGAVKISRHNSAQGLAHAARGMLTQVDGQVIESLPEVAVPTLVLVGSLDKPFLAASDYMAGKIPDATKVIIDQAGHTSNIEKPEEFNRSVSEFLDQISF